MSELINLLSCLCAVFGPSGGEDAVREKILQELSACDIKKSVDSLGNLFVHYPCGKVNAKRLMLSAHMDEVGFMITRIDEDGFLFFDTLGGMDKRILAGRPVTVFGNDKNYLNGVIGSMAIHHQDAAKRKSAFNISQLYIDIGARNKDEAMRLCRVGDFATFDSQFYRFGSSKIKGKAIDDRIGCAIMVLLIKHLLQLKAVLDYDVVFCFSVREEIGLSGAGTAAFAVSPDFALVLESTAVADIYGVEDNSKVALQGQGGALSIMDRSTVYDRKLFDFIYSLGAKNDIKLQIKKFVSGGNDAGHIHISQSGVRTAALSLPTRYLHSASCVADIRDCEAMLELCRVFIAQFGNFLKFE